MESMKDFEKELEESYKLMGDGERDTDALIAWGKVAELCESKENITVTVSGIVKGGVIAMVEGLRAFIPASRLSLSKIDDLNDWLGKEIQVRVITADMEADKLVLSAKEILKEAAAQNRQKMISEIKEGEVYIGTVETLQPYGAFVKIGDGISGLVHISQISHDRIKHPKVLLSEGQEVNVKVIGNKDGKISLSMKALIEQADVVEENEEYELPESEEIGTSLASLFANIKL